jgi:ferredoxin--NADP+ reductase
MPQPSTINHSTTQQKPNPNAPTSEKVLSVKHYTDRLFAFTLTRPDSFRFRSGEFIMLGLQGEKKPIMRAYSVCSPSWEETLEFFSIKVPDGPLTSRLQKIQPGDEVLLGRKPVGTLVLDALTPAKRLYMFSTGTGFAPFASLIRDNETYEKFDEVIVTHTCREVAELQYSRETVEATLNHEFLGEFAQGKLRYFDSCTREDHPRKGRITDLITSGSLFEQLGVPALNPETDRVMICGSTEMTQDTKQICLNAGMVEGANNAPADFVIERAFVG